MQALAFPPARLSFQPRTADTSYEMEPGISRVLVAVW